MVGTPPERVRVRLLCPPYELLRDVNGFASSTMLKQGFNGDGAVVSYLKNKGDDHETYDPSTGLCVRALKYVRTCAHKSKSS